MNEDIEALLYSTQPAFPVECIEISHSLWSAPLRYVTNMADGVSVFHDNTYFNYEYMQLQIQRSGASNDLDQSLTITVSDLGTSVPALIDQIFDADSLEYPSVSYRIYSSIDFTKPVLTIENLGITDQTSDEQGTTFKAEAQKLNVNGTGRLFTIENFPGLKGFY
ncbi:hypothetical protein CDG60_12200 [Acinetobacter chinensis]|uniref:DUF1833 domain-containing protein n=1 Tax=Acinetobacter chinensis TaxID=2004650 RepID=A0A3B7M406_9GAMM|nr:hypothetical protein [Acinetobacter chinensis]AXY57259.1 hypothetical protein CDG60_12200 [Acinetobacter chinensis]